MVILLDYCFDHPKCKFYNIKELEMVKKIKKKILASGTLWTNKSFESHGFLVNSEKLMKAKIFF